MNVLPLPNATPTVVPATCGANGSITLTITAGTPPVSVTWNTVPPQTGLTATNLQPGPYAATLTDANGCVNTVSAFVGAPPGALLAWLQSSQEPLCHGQSNGSATIGVTGGTPPYTYSWSHAPALNASVATGLPAGGYTVTVTDNAGCSFVVTFSLGQPAPLTLSIDPARQNEPVSCSGSCNGIITVEADGGVPPRTYTWSSSTHPGFSFTGVDAAGTQVSGLCEGEYTINVTDANGCTASLTVTLGVVPLSYSLSQVDALCFGAPQGSVSVTINSAHSGTTWQWTGPNNYTSALNETNPTGLVPGKYYITFTIPGCLQPVIDSIEVGSPPEIVITPSPTLPLCHGDANGLITIIASGGVGNYQYNLNGGAWRASNTFSNLAAGTYVLGVKDGNECEKFLTYTLPEPDPLTFDPPTIRDVSCHEGSDGSITVGLNGGTPPYEYSLNGGITWQANPLFSGLPAGSYTITVRDANSCTASQTVTIHQPDPLAFNPPQIQNVSCHGGNNGSITISVNGGTPPYEYSLNGGITWQANPLFSGLPAGSYTVTVRDANQCTLTQTINISQPPPLSFTFSVTPPRCHGETGTLSFQAVGGVGGYEYGVNGTYSSSSTVSVPAGTYTLTVRDANGCLSPSQTITIAEPPPLIGTVLSLSPATCRESADGTVALTATGGTSTTGTYTYIWISHPQHSGSSANTLRPGEYEVVVRDENGCEDTIRFSIGYRSFVDAALEPLERTGCIPLAVEWIALPSGVGPFTYEWDLGTGTTATDSVVQEVYLVENRYTIRLIIRNRDGCSDTANAVVEASALPEMSYIIEPDTNEDRVVGTLFTLRSTGQNVEEVWWEVEGYGRLTGSTIQVRFDQEGIYCYTFWARRGSCIDSTEGCIRVKDAYVYIPNAFSPNGDGINDVYEVRTFGLQRPRVRIYDRWGALVFDNQGDMNRHWDGTYRGVPVPEDAYTVVIEGVLPPTDKPIRRTGTVTVVR
ncbi:MAG: gliding motility-associated C-terminal domain-containing protein [Bacteroidia bacterium]|nr:gliding motility-associated C-terminal domain-containing protein [Bacteroidia bacterium]